jgi:hypothetical protein
VRKIQLSVILVVLAAIPMLPPASLAQQPSNVNEQPKVGIGVKVSTLGAGVEVAVPLLRKLNVRGGFNAISYGHNFHQDGILYAGNLSWRSGEASVDWYPFGGPFHLSPGLLAYNGNKITANASVPGGQDFTLSGVTYMSGVSDPILGTGKLDFTKVAPTFRLGFGNLVPRSCIRRHAAHHPGVYRHRLCAGWIGLRQRRDRSDDPNERPGGAIEDQQGSVYSQVLSNPFPGCWI